MKKIKELVLIIMERYAVVTELVIADIVKFGKYLLAGLIVAVLWILLAVTIPGWYLPYKYLTKGNMGGINETGSDRD